MHNSLNAQGYANTPTIDVLGGGDTQAPPLSISGNPPAYLAQHTQPSIFLGNWGGAGEPPSRPGGRNSIQPPQTDLFKLPYTVPLSYYVLPSSNLDNRDTEIIDILRQEVTECVPQYLVVSCNCRRHVVKHTCMRLSCRICHPILTRRRASAVMDRFIPKTISGYSETSYPTVNYTVFTMPYQLRPNCIDRKYMTKLRAKVFELLKTKYGADFAFEATHPIAEDNPTEFHPHLNFLWTQKKGFPHYLNLDMLRADYADILGYTGSPYLYHEYSNNPGEIWKWCEYVARTFPAYAKWCGHTKWFGNYPKLPEREHCKCAHCGSGFHLIGWISASHIEAYELFGSKSGLAPPWDDDTKITLIKSKSKQNQYGTVDHNYYSELL
jgi:hypothetical protein